jgi:hypothetical protein
LAIVLSNSKPQQHKRYSKPQHNKKEFSKEEFEDTKGVIRIRKSKKDRQHNGQKKKGRSTKATHETKD